jgi:23S rRNA pseudouridine2605 synthase
LPSLRSVKQKTMVFKKPGNSRDDKSTRSPKGRSKGDDANKRSSAAPRGKFSAKSENSNNANPKKRFDNDNAGERKSYSASAGKSFGNRSADADDKPKKRFGADSGDKKPFSAAGRKPYSGRPTGDSDRPKRAFGADSGERKPFSPAGKRPYSGRPADGDGPRKSFGGDAAGEKRPYGTRGKSFDDKPKRSFGDDSGEKKFNRRPTEDGPKKRATGGFKENKERTYRKTEGSDRPKRIYDNSASNDGPARVMRERKNGPKDVKTNADNGLIRLNRYIANAGICSRRKADELIEAGVVSVNGVVISELGYKVDPMKDEVRYNNETLKREKNIYVLLNKPKDYITTTDDPLERRTVMQLVEKASKERIYPVGRLDRNTTGLLLMTNDGDLADKLSHPRSNIVKLYQVELNKNLVQGDLNKIGFGIELEDGLIKPDSVSYVTGGSKREIGIQIHSGKNRIVRRIFEHLGYEVVKLDRVVYAGLTKKDLPRGRWRYLDEKEIIQLKHLI